MMSDRFRHRPGGGLLFPTLAALTTAMAAIGTSFERAVELITSAGQRVGVLANVGGVLEYLSPQSRTAGGYGVVASVDSATQVTLAAGYTLGSAGRCRLWDKSGGVHLDSGGVEWRRSGLVVTLPDTTGLAAGDVVYSDRLEFNDYAQCVALATALGTSFNGELRLVNRTSGAVILRRVVRDGAWTSTEVNFANVTATPNAVAASVAGSVVTVTAGHTITTLAKTLRVWNTTDGTLIADEASGAWSVTGNDVTMGAATAAAVAAALGAAKIVRLWVEGVSELCIGGAGCAVQPIAGAWFAHGLGLSGEVLLPCCGSYRGQGSGVFATFASGNSEPVAANDRIMIGWGTGAAVHVLGGTGVVATGNRIGYRLNATQSCVGGLRQPSPLRVGLTYSASILGSESVSMNAIGPAHGGAPTSCPVSLTETDYLGAPVMLSAVVAGKAGAVCALATVRSM